MKIAHLDAHEGIMPAKSGSASLRRTMALQVERRHRHRRAGNAVCRFSAASRPKNGGSTELIPAAG